MTARPDARSIFDPDTYRAGVPYELFADLRPQRVVWVDEPAVLGWPAGPGFYAVLQHRDVKAVLRDHRAFSSALAGTQIRDYATDEDLAEVRQQILNMDPPEHDRMRRLFAQAFTPKAVARLETGIRDHASSIVRSMRERETFDFVELASDLPLLVLADVLGIPSSDRYLMHDWSNRVIGYQDPDYTASAVFDAEQGSEMARRAVRVRPSAGPDGRTRTRAGMPDLYTYAREMAIYKRLQPGDDVMSIMLQARDGPRQLSDEEFENLCWLFFVAGTETVRNALSNGMRLLLEHPATYEALRQDPSRVGSAVEEMLRYSPPVMHFRRTATRQRRIAGTELRRGDKVVVWHVSANRDPAVFQNPDRFDIDQSPNDHLSFGYGPTSVLEPTWPGPNSAHCSPASSRSCPPSTRPVNRSGSCPTSRTDSSPYQ